VASVPFLKFVATRARTTMSANYSFVLRGYVGTGSPCLERVRPHQLTDIVAPANPCRAIPKIIAPLRANRWISSENLLI